MIAKPFNSIADTVESLSSSASHQDDTQAYQRAESYYAYARRRFGLLDRSLTACHCYFLSGIYLPYTLRPVQAWQSFFEASLLHTVYLKSRAAVQTAEEDGRPDTELRCRLEQRLYWSCVESERYSLKCSHAATAGMLIGGSEISVEVDLPRSGLHGVDYPYQFHHHRRQRVTSV